MEILMLLICLAVAGMYLTGNILLTVILVRYPGREKATDTPQQEQEDSPSAEARRRYEQGFLNLIQYDGRPNRDKEREHT